MADLPPETDAMLLGGVSPPLLGGDTWELQEIVRADLHNSSDLSHGIHGFLAHVHLNPLLFGCISPITMS